MTPIPLVERVKKYQASPKGRIAKHRADHRSRERFLARMATLKDAACIDCGNKFPPECMDFDHRPDTIKRFNVSQSPRKWSVILEEVSKCDLICANCHRIRTKKRKAK